MSSWLPPEQTIQDNKVATMSYDLASEVSLHHFHTILLVTQASPVQNGVYTQEALGATLEAGNVSFLSFEVMTYEEYKGTPLGNGVMRKIPLSICGSRPHMKFNQLWKYDQKNLRYNFF